MVAAGAAALMAASESGSSKGNEGVTSPYDSQNAQRSNDNEGKKIVKVEKKNSFRNPGAVKTTPIRETKASRLRAASITSPTESTPVSRKSAVADSLNSWSSQSGTSSLKKPKSPMSSTSRVSTCATRERDKTAKRGPVSIKLPEGEEKRQELVNYYERSERTRMRRTNVKQTTSGKTECNESASFLRKNDFQQQQQQSTCGSTTSRTTCAVASSSGMKTRSATQRTSVEENSEVLRRVDALTALTKATMERVERLTSSASMNGRSRIPMENRNSGIPTSGTLEKNVYLSRRSKNLSTNVDASITNNNRNSTVTSNNNNDNEEEETNDRKEEASTEAIRHKNRQAPPISILKHKSPEITEGTSSSSTSGGSSIMEQLTKKHGILKKRSSLDDNEILRRRRSCSPETVCPETNGSGFKPILKYERRSSLDELVNKSQSPDRSNHQQQQHPTSILKRKSSGEEEREDGQSCSEPTSILKRSSGSSVKNNGNGHHVSIAAAVAKTLGCANDCINSSEVRPILKKKYSREESSSSDPPSLEPRPILKKKSSTDSDEHDERPKTILKSSRKSSQEDSGNEIDSASPRKLSMLKNRSVQRRTNSLPECDVVRPILKQSSSSRESSSPSRSSLAPTVDSFNLTTKDLFLRKRARSVSHVQSTGNDSWLESQAHLHQDQNSFLFTNAQRHHHPYQNITSRSNESTNIAAAAAAAITTITVTTTTTTTTTATTTTTTITNNVNTNSTETATSSIAPIVSFKLPSRTEMMDRYEIEDDDDYNCQTDEGTNTNCLNFRYNFNNTDNDNNDEDKTTSLNSRQKRSSRRGNEWTPRIIISDPQKSLFLSSSASSSCSKEKDTTMDEKSSSNRSMEIGTNVSRIAQRFKILEEQRREEENRFSRKEHFSKEEKNNQQRYDRFNTQPVTYEEVREAVLQNQRKAASKDSEKDNESDKNNEDNHDNKWKEIEPSKLSLAERVKLFNRRIATESISKDGSTLERSQRRRPANRYKTQPITSEEVEVASRIFPTDNNNEEMTKMQYEDPTNHHSDNSDFIIEAADSPAPRSILKTSSSSTSSSILQTANDKCCSRLRDNRRDCNDSVAMIDEAYLLSSELKLTRKEFTARRLQRRKYNRDNKRNGESETLRDRENNSERIENFINEPVVKKENILSAFNCDETPAVPSSYDNIELRDNAESTKIRQLGRDTADYAETTHSAKQSSRIRPFVDKIPSQFDNISLDKKDKIITDMQQIHFPSISIADRLAALQRSGTTDWKRRVNTENVLLNSTSLKFVSNETLRETTTTTTTQAEKDELATKQRKLAERLEKLESAAEGWRKRVAVPDAIKFSVAGKMRVEHDDNYEQISPLVEVATNCGNDGKKKIPRPERFRSCKYTKDSTSTTINEVEDKIANRQSSSESNSESSEDETKSFCRSATILSVPKADDEAFTSFFSNVSFDKYESESIDIPESDFDVVTSFSERLGTRRTVKTQRRRLPSKNPIRNLAARTDIKDEYTEITTGVAERVMRSLNIEKLAKKSSLAVEALAGLASTEDFGAVTLKNVDTDATGYGNRLPPQKDVMLILVKGRRHVQIRLVEPIVSSINSGDNFILVTRHELYNYVGKYSNVIERARGAEIALSIQQNRDLGCRANTVITISEEKATCTNSEIENFWKILGADAPHSVGVIDAGHPDEDELYESALLDTNMVYEVASQDELIPLEKYWGAMPKIEMLDPSKILVFDFGSEMYIWNGKIAPSEKKKIATRLAEELWQEGYDYTECTISPINAASIIGRRTKIDKNVKKSSTRPEWCLIGKLTQHMETVLFREKFLNWPNVSRIIRIKESPEKEQVDGKIVIEPPDVDTMIDYKNPVVDLVLEGSHLGRGTGWYDDETMRQFIVSTTDVTVWHIDEFSYSLLSGSSIGQFYTGDSYIVRWMYTVTITGRGLSGEPSKHASTGRDRCAYFIWQGQKASLNEQGTAALLTIELDQEQGPQIRVPEGFEPAAFLNLFSGKMMVHDGKKMKNCRNEIWRMYVCRGSEETETSLTEVPCSTRQLRSRGSLLLSNTVSGIIYVWHGCSALPHIRKNALRAANLLKENRPAEAGFNDRTDVTIFEINEADEAPAEFFEALGGMNKQLYVPLQENKKSNHTPRLFHLSSVSGEFAATELLCPHRSELATPFPFLQDELYLVNQPALFLLDNKDELWLWQGWWPDSGSEDQTGSGAVRWQAERRAAMISAMRYWKKLYPGSNEFPVYLVRAGLEPLKFTNLFPTWNYRDDIAELNIRDGRDSGEVLTVESELARLTQSTYPVAQLLQRPLPEGVDPTILERYLSPQHFEELLGMNIEEFEKLPAWKQINVKKRIGLF